VGSAVGIAAVVLVRVSGIVRNAAMWTNIGALDGELAQIAPYRGNFNSQFKERPVLDTPLKGGDR